MAKVDWDQSQDKASSGFEVMPKGRYPCRIVETSKEPTKKKDGYFFKITFEVVKGDFTKRKLWAMLNISNPSAQAQLIGREMFKALCEAAGKPTVKDTSELHDKFVVCIVDIDRQPDQSDRNKVTGFMSVKAFKDGGAVTPEKKATPAAPAKPAKGAAKEPPKGSDDFDDDIPF